MPRTAARSGTVLRSGLVATAVCLALTGVGVAGCGSEAPTTPRTAKVQRAAVSTSVSAMGSLSAIDQANVGFPKGGQLTSVRVRVGDRVGAGDVLATIDDFSARQALAQARSQLDAQQAQLDRLESGTAVPGAEASLDQANRVVSATRAQANATVAADDAAIAQARQGLAAAQQGAAAAQAKFQADYAACYPSGGTAPECVLVPGDQAAVTQAQSGVSSAQSALAQAQQKRTVDVASGRVQIETARGQAVMAQNQLAQSSADRPGALDAQRAAVDGARAGVRNAEQDLANTTLRAPVAGTVSSLNGAVGEFVAPSSGTTALAPGSDAAIPGAASAAGAAGAGAAAAAATPSRPGGSQFMVLQSPGTFQVVAPFQESDAASILPNQAVAVGVDAIPDASLPGQVLSVAPSGDAISNVINYYVTVALAHGDPRLKDGQTARASVITGQVPNAISVPNSAVRRQGDRSSVVIVHPGGRQETVPVTPGVEGPDRTQILTGLTEGQDVLLGIGS
jgi:HlyD family secretion protein